MRTQWATPADLLGNCEVVVGGVANPPAAEYLRGRDQPGWTDAMFRTLQLRRQSAVARPGDIIEHPITRERLTFLETSAETGGASVRYQLEVAPGGFVAAPHVHPWIEERIDIVSGEWIFVIEGIERKLGPGDWAIIPARQVHSWRNAGPETGVAIVECRPALKTEEFFETFFGLAQDGLVDPTSGLPFQPWLAMMVVEYHNDFAHPAEPPLRSSSIRCDRSLTRPADRACASPTHIPIRIARPNPCGGRVLPHEPRAIPDPAPGCRAPRLRRWLPAALNRPAVSPRAEHRSASGLAKGTRASSSGSITMPGTTPAGPSGLTA